MRRLSSSGGFTLLEFIFALSLTFMVIMVSTMLLVSSIRGYQRVDLTESSSHATAIGTEYIGRDLRATYRVVASYGGNTTSNSSIVLQVPSYGASGIIGSSYDYISYAVNAQKNLTRTTVSNGGLRINETNRVLAKGVTNLGFTYTCRNTFQGNGATTTFTLPVAYIGTPFISINGVPVTSGVTFNHATNSLTFSTAPSLNENVEVLYQVSPSSSTVLAQVMQVTVQMNSQQTGGDNSRTATLSTTVRLRNKR